MSRKGRVIPNKMMGGVILVNEKENWLFLKLISGEMQELRLSNSQIVSKILEFYA